MADSSLDDFFAKKDKNKKKGKSKVTPYDLLEKQKVKKKKGTSEKKKDENPQQLEVDPAKLKGIVSKSSVNRSVLPKVELLFPFGQKMWESLD